MKKKIIKKPLEIGAEDSLPTDKDGKEEPLPINVAGIFEKVFNPPDKSEEE